MSDRNGTRLNQLDGSTGPLGPVGPDVGWSVPQQKAAAEYVEKHLGPDTNKAGVMADTDNNAMTGDPNVPSAISPGALRGWDLEAGLTHRRDEWETALRQLKGRIEAELQGLRNTGILFSNNELETESALRGLITPELEAGAAGDNRWRPPYAAPRATSPIADL
ncbi:MULTISPECIES: hypothetical protein [unclassified Streptomyces]|uniref:hypothetical protein n=1 Tax=unclassified Streptomyces TaxID=2593676 RepID=UPI0022B6B6D5|nr:MULTISPECIES: hypothetical protein [unclassified Streptomyces]MCZ7413166.1 hypothetical protein [Streptomyces sp. WMMC897]MCZ7417800.1 hypothetical protein [Streptomyces sp. WMMC897]MCZ7432395.1 hypothetical protein [Streptomyces sp. WMMC1477]MCZ7432404.1 hypothetical protein [Streptomyces sp. WMMC1477]